MPKLMTQPSEKAVFMIAAFGVTFALLALLFVPKIEAGEGSHDVSGSASRPTSGPASSQPAGSSSAPERPAVEELRQTEVSQETRDTIEAARSSTGDGIGFPIDLYAELLDRYLDDGLVDYQGLSTTGRNGLEALVKIIEETDATKLNSLPKDEFIAWKINAYNILTLDTIVDNYPLNSIKDLNEPWDTPLNVAGQALTLNNIEHQILRKVDEPDAERIEFMDPRLHFAVNCAAIGCPVLQGIPFTAENTDELYHAGALLFLNNPDRVRLENGTLYLSQLMDWYGDDFYLVNKADSQPLVDKLRSRGVSQPEKVASVVWFFSTVADDDLAAELREGNYDAEWINYDWALNTQ